MKPDLKGVAGPGTDAGGPNVYTLHMHVKSKISISAKGYKDKNSKGISEHIGYLPVQKPGL